MGGDSVAMAKRLGRSSSLIQKWCEPSTDFSDSGAYNPLDRINGMMDEAELLRKSSKDILAPIRYLSKGRGFFIPTPKITFSSNQIILQTAKTIKEVGEALTAAGMALEDNKLTPNERRQVLREMDEAIHELTLLEGMFRG